MAKFTLYGVPSSAWESAKEWFSGPLLLALWRLFLLTVTALAIAGAVIVWPIGVVLAVVAFPLGWFWGDDIKAILADVWNADWAEVST